MHLVCCCYCKLWFPCWRVLLSQTPSRQTCPAESQGQMLFTCPYEQLPWTPSIWLPLPLYKENTHQLFLMSCSWLLFYCNLQPYLAFREMIFPPPLSSRSHGFPSYEKMRIEELFSFLETGSLPCRKSWPWIRSRRLSLLSSGGMHRHIW